MISNNFKILISIFFAGILIVCFIGYRFFKPDYKETDNKLKNESVALINTDRDFGTNPGNLRERFALSSAISAWRIVVGGSYFDC